MKPEAPPLAPTALDAAARADPLRPWAAFWDADKSGYQDVTIGAFDNAANRTALWARETFGSPPEGEVPAIAYLGPSDFRYYAVAMGLVRAGFTTLLLSHLNTLSANEHLFQSTKCIAAVHGFSGSAPSSFQVPGVRSVRALSNDETWDSKLVDVVKYPYSDEEAERKPFVIAHTSGSTGTPKPIHVFFGAITAVNQRFATPDYKGFETHSNIRRRAKRLFLAWPPFHSSGMLFGLSESVHGGRTICFPPDDRPVDAKLACEGIMASGADGAELLPHVLEQMARTPETWPVLQKLQYLAWVGGPISQNAGDILCQHVLLMNVYGSTEAGLPELLMPAERTDWYYYFMYPDRGGWEFHPVDGIPDLYELVVVRKPDMRQAAFVVFPHLDKFETKDLFRKHPTLEHHWRSVGRVDDLIILQSGAKMIPGPLQEAIQRTGVVAAVVAGGSGRLQPFILVEPLRGEDGVGAAKDQFVDTLWPFVQEANAEAGSHAQLLKELIIVVEPDRPLPRAGKGTVQRVAALQLYEKDIDEAYAQLPSHLQRPADYRLGVAAGADGGG